MLFAYPRVALFLALVAAPAWGEPSPEGVLARCQAGTKKFKSPAEIFQAQGLDVQNACPFQTQVDKAHECQDAATVLQNMYDILQEFREKTCASAQEAVSQSKRDCQDQASCVQAQKAALDKFRGILREEIDLLGDYAKQADLSMGYAVEAIAGGGVKVLRELKKDHSASDDGTNKYGPRGVDWATRFVQAQNNDDAMTRVFRNENEQRAAEIVQKFKDGKGTPSDITGIKSDLIREPLRVAAVGLEWKRQVEAYQRDLEGQLGRMGNDSMHLANTSEKMGKLGERSLKPAPESTVTHRRESAPGATGAAPAAAAAPAPATSPSGGLGRTLDGLNGLAKAASSLAPLMANQDAAGDAAEDAPSDTPELPSLGFGEARKSPLSAKGAVPGNTESPRSTTDGAAKSDKVSPELNRLGSGLALGAPGLAGPFGRAGAGRTASSASRTGAASAKAAGGRAVATAGTSAGGLEPGRELAEAGGRDPGEARSGAVGNGSDSVGYGNAGSSGGGSTAAESNEKAVQGIVGDWEKALNPGKEEGPTAEAATLAASTEILPGETQTLFLRVRVAHERAQKRGSLLRSVPSRL